MTISQRLLIAIDAQQDREFTLDNERLCQKTLHLVIFHIFNADRLNEIDPMASRIYKLYIEYLIEN